VTVKDVAEKRFTAGRRAVKPVWRWTSSAMMRPIKKRSAAKVHAGEAFGRFTWFD
jgi:hypothetical protein